MSFEIDGFFSPDIEQFREAVRTGKATKPWFDYAYDLNRIGFDLLRDAQTPKNDNQRFTLHALFVRAHQSFQAALVLAERGLIPDARTVLRSGVESAIAIHAVANDGAFVQRLIDAHHRERRLAANVLLANTAYLATYSAEQVATIKQAVADVDALEVAAGHIFQKINWADTAAQYCPDLYQLLYRDLSQDGTHTTLQAIDRYLETDDDLNVTAFRVGPDGNDMTETLGPICLLFLWAADPIADAFGRPDVAAKLKEQVQRFGTLPNAFPRRAPEAA